MPEFPLEVNVADFRLSQVKGWKVPGDHTGSVKMKRSLDDLHGNRGGTYRGWGDSGAVSPDDLNGVDPDRHLSCRIRFQQSPVEPLQGFGPRPRLQEVPLDPTPPSRYCGRLYTGATGGSGINTDGFNRCSRISFHAKATRRAAPSSASKTGVSRGSSGAYASLVGDTGAATRGGGPSPGPAGRPSSRRGAGAIISNLSSSARIDPDSSLRFATILGALPGSAESLRGAFLSRLLRRVRTG
uniref:(California timema) hypothetical protein n=1 Tax=Timema californicum TaxID=61474 RepID=A0A7R9J1V7_TIMCA|nr:unnamed protein product [Timema californicum]